MGFLSFLIRLNGDASGFKNSINESTRAFEGLGNKVKAGVNGIVGHLQALATVEKIMGGIRGEMQKASEIKFGAGQLGTDFGTFQKMEIDAEKARISVEQLKNSVDKLGESQAKILTKSNSGGTGSGGELGRYFKVLGFGESDLQRDPLANLLALKERTAGNRMTTEQRVALHRLTGSRDLVPFLERAGSPSDYVGVRSDAQVASMSVASKDMADSKGIFSGLLRRTLVDNTYGKDPKTGASIHGSKPSDIFLLYHSLANFARIAGGTPPDKIKSLDQAFSEVLKKNKEFASEKKESFQDTIALLNEEIDRQEALLRSKRLEVALDKESARHKSLEIKMHESGMSEREIYEDRIRKANAQMALGIPNKDSRVLFEQAENDKLEAQIGLKMLDKRGGHLSGSPSSLERTGGFIGSRQDPLIDVNRQQLQELREIKTGINQIKSQFGGRGFGRSGPNIPDEAFP